jgi:hypothetical protein
VIAVWDPEPSIVGVTSIRPGTAFTHSAGSRRTNVAVSEIWNDQRFREGGLQRGKNVTQILFQKI